MDAYAATTNLVIRPVDGHVITVSGTRIPQPPWILPDDPATLAAYDQWLVAQGRYEAQELGDSWMIARLAEAVGATMDAPQRELLSDFLFGQAHPVFEARQLLEASAS